MFDINDWSMDREYNLQNDIQKIILEDEDICQETRNVNPNEEAKGIYFVNSNSNRNNMISSSVAGCNDSSFSTTTNHKNSRHNDITPKINSSADGQFSGLFSSSTITSEIITSSAIFSSDLMKPRGFNCPDEVTLSAKSSMPSTGVDLPATGPGSGYSEQNTIRINKFYSKKSTTPSYECDSTASDEPFTSDSDCGEWSPTRPDDCNSKSLMPYTLDLTTGCPRSTSGCGKRRPTLLGDLDPRAKRKTSSSVFDPTASSPVFSSGKERSPNRRNEWKCSSNYSTLDLTTRSPRSMSGCGGKSPTLLDDSEPRAKSKMTSVYDSKASGPVFTSGSGSKEWSPTRPEEWPCTTNRPMPSNLDLTAGLPISTSPTRPDEWNYGSRSPMPSSLDLTTGRPKSTGRRRPTFLGHWDRNERSRLPCSEDDFSASSPILAIGNCGRTTGSDDSAINLTSAVGNGIRAGQQPDKRVFGGRSLTALCESNYSAIRPISASGNKDDRRNSWSNQSAGNRMPAGGYDLALWRRVGGKMPSDLKRLTHFDRSLMPSNQQSLTARSENSPDRFDCSSIHRTGFRSFVSVAEYDLTANNPTYSTRSTNDYESVKIASTSRNLSSDFDYQGERLASSILNVGNPTSLPAYDLSTSTRTSTSSAGDAFRAVSPILSSERLATYPVSSGFNAKSPVALAQYDHRANSPIASPGSERSFIPYGYRAISHAGNEFRTRRESYSKINGGKARDLRDNLPAKHDVNAERLISSPVCDFRAPTPIFLPDLRARGPSSSIRGETGNRMNRERVPSTDFAMSPALEGRNAVLSDTMIKVTYKSSPALRLGQMHLQRHYVERPPPPALYTCGILMSRPSEWYLEALEMYDGDVEKASAARLPYRRWYTPQVPVIVQTCTMKPKVKSIYHRHYDTEESDDGRGFSRRSKRFDKCTCAQTRPEDSPSNIGALPVNEVEELPASQSESPARHRRRKKRRSSIILNDERVDTSSVEDSETVPPRKRKSVTVLSPKRTRSTGRKQKPSASDLNDADESAVETGDDSIETAVVIPHRKHTPRKHKTKLVFSPKRTRSAGRESKGSAGVDEVEQSILEVADVTPALPKDTSETQKSELVSSLEQIENEVGEKGDEPNVDGLEVGSIDSAAVVPPLKHSSRKIPRRSRANADISDVDPVEQSSIVDEDIETPAVVPPVKHSARKRKSELTLSPKRTRSTGKENEGNGDVSRISKLQERTPAALEVSKATEPLAVDVLSPVKRGRRSKRASLALAESAAKKRAPPLKRQNRSQPTDERRESSESVMAAPECAYNVNEEGFVGFSPSKVAPHRSRLAPTDDSASNSDVDQVTREMESMFSDPDEVPVLSQETCEVPKNLDIVKKRLLTYKKIVEKEEMLLSKRSKKVGRKFKKSGEDIEQPDQEIEPKLVIDEDASIRRSRRSRIQKRPLYLDEYVDTEDVLAKGEKGPQVRKPVGSPPINKTRLRRKRSESHGPEEFEWELAVPEDSGQDHNEKTEREPKTENDSVVKVSPRKQKSRDKAKRLTAESPMANEEPLSDYDNVYVLPQKQSREKVKGLVAESPKATEEPKPDYDNVNVSPRKQRSREKVKGLAAESPKAGEKPKPDYDNVMISPRKQRSRDKVKGLAAESPKAIEKPNCDNIKISPRKQKNRDTLNSLVNEIDAKKMSEMPTDDEAETRPRHKPKSLKEAKIRLDEPREDVSTDVRETSNKDSQKATDLVTNSTTPGDSTQFKVVDTLPEDASEIVIDYNCELTISDAEPVVLESNIFQKPTDSSTRHLNDSEAETIVENGEMTKDKSLEIASVDPESPSKKLAATENIPANDAEKKSVKSSTPVKGENGVVRNLLSQWDPLIVPNKGPKALSPLVVLKKMSPEVRMDYINGFTPKKRPKSEERKPRHGHRDEDHVLKHKNRSDKSSHRRSLDSKERHGHKHRHKESKHKHRSAESKKERRESENKLVQERTNESEKLNSKSVDGQPESEKSRSKSVDGGKHESEKSRSKSVEERPRKIHGDNRHKSTEHKHKSSHSVHEIKGRPAAVEKPEVMPESVVRPKAIPESPPSAQPIAAAPQTETPRIQARDRLAPAAVPSPTPPPAGPENPLIVSCIDIFGGLPKPVLRKEKKKKKETPGVKRIVVASPLFGPDPTSKGKEEKMKKQKKNISSGKRLSENVKAKKHTQATLKNLGKKGVVSATRTHAVNVGWWKLKYGWKKECRARVSDPKTIDKFYFSPKGRRFRTKPEIVKYLEDTKSSLTLEKIMPPGCEKFLKNFEPPAKGSPKKKTSPEKKNKSGSQAEKRKKSESSESTPVKKPKLSDDKTQTILNLLSSQYPLIVLEPLSPEYLSVGENGGVVGKDVVTAKKKKKKATAASNSRESSPVKKKKIPSSPGSNTKSPKKKADSRNASPVKKSTEGSPVKKKKSPGSTDGSPKKKKDGQLKAAGVNLEDIMFIDPRLPKGWKRMVRFNSSGKAYISIISPTGKRCRTPKALGEYLQSEKLPYHAEHFDFTRKGRSDAGPVVEDPALADYYRQLAAVEASKPTAAVDESKKKSVKSKHGAPTSAVECSEDEDVDVMEMLPVLEPMSREEALELYRQVASTIAKVQPPPPLPEIIVVPAKPTIAEKVRSVLVACELSSARAARRISQKFSAGGAKLPQPTAEVHSCGCSAEEVVGEDDATGISTEWINDLARCRPDVFPIETEAASSLAAATEEFIQRLVVMAYERSGCKSVEYGDLADTVAEHAQLAPLKPLLPKTINFKHFKRINRPTRFYTFA